MKVEIERKFHITLSEKEGLWLRSLIQNSTGEETNEQYDMRKALFDALARPDSVLLKSAAECCPEASWWRDNGMPKQPTHAIEKTDMDTLTSTEQEKE